MDEVLEYDIVQRTSSVTGRITQILYVLLYEGSTIPSKEILWKSKCQYETLINWLNLIN